jgi:hypothetical protein
MALDVKKFGKANVQYNSTLRGEYVYDAAADALADVLGANYFGDLARLLKEGDEIKVSASDGDQDLNVDSNDGTTVVVS